MAIYEFECIRCKTKHDRFCLMKDIDEEFNKSQKCPECDSSLLRIYNGGTGTIFVGGGWPSKQIKIDKIVEEQEKIMEEPISSKDEVDTGIGMAKDRAKARGIPEERLTGQAPEKPRKPKTGEQMKKEAESQVKMHSKAWR